MTDRSEAGDQAPITEGQKPVSEEDLSWYVLDFYRPKDVDNINRALERELHRSTNSSLQGHQKINDLKSIVTSTVAVLKFARSDTEHEDSVSLDDRTRVRVVVHGDGEQNPEEAVGGLSSPTMEQHAAMADQLAMLASGGSSVASAAVPATADPALSSTIVVRDTRGRLGSDFDAFFQ